MEAIQAPADCLLEVHTRCPSGEAGFQKCQGHRGHVHAAQRDLGIFHGERDPVTQSLPHHSQEA